MSSPPTQLNILIAGSGVAGPTLAYWLHRLLPSAHITILERSPVPRCGGQAVDLRGASVRIVERMGLLKAVKERHTGEEGMQFVYYGNGGDQAATFPSSGDDEAQSMTSEYEILRGDLAQLLMDTTKSMDRISYIFGTQITSLTQDPTTGKTHATFENTTLLPDATYDLVVGADGMTSRTRRLLFGTGPDNQNYLYRLGQYAAFFTIPRTEQDTKLAQWYNAPRGRLIFLRPDPYGSTRAYLSVTDADLSRFDEYDVLLRAGDRKAQEAWFEREFHDAGWQAERVLRGMRDSDDFYTQQIAQVKMEAWVRGSAALVGDAAFCPSPISGVGAGTAIVGAYVLAGEVARSPHDIPRALERYQETVRPYVKSVQRLIPGAPQITNPQTPWGVWTFNKATGFFASSYVKTIGGAIARFFPAFAGTGWPLPDYEKDLFGEVAMGEEK